MGIRYRTGEREDSEKLAEMINTASDGIVEYLFHDLIPGMTPVQILSQNLEEDHYPHTYRSAVVAYDGSDLIGMALSFPSSYHKITDEMRTFFPAERLDHFSALYSSRVENSWLLHALFVIDSHRRQGIGEELISLTKNKAVEKGYDALSLIVFADNRLAIPLYERTGFKVVQKVELDGNQYIQHSGGCILMKCDLTTT